MSAFGETMLKVKIWVEGSDRISWTKADKFCLGRKSFLGSQHLPLAKLHSVKEMQNVPAFFWT